MGEPYVIGASRHLEPLVFEFRGHVYEVDPDPDVELMGTLLRAENAIRNRDDLEMPVAVAVVEAKDIIMRLLRDRNEDVPSDLGMGVGDVLEIIGFLGGGASAAEEVAQALTEGALARAEAAGEPEPQVVEEGEADATPLSSASSKKSSGSAKSSGGRRSTGAASRGESGKRSTSKRAVA